MTNPISRNSGSLSSNNRVPEGFSYRQGKNLVHRQNAAIADGIVAATTVQAKGFIAMIGIQLVGSLAREAAFQSGGDPQIAARTDLLIDQFTMSVANQIARM